ncbi:hypothetical protein D3C81_1564960 [compost metagenome]
MVIVEDGGSHARLAAVYLQVLEAATGSGLDLNHKVLSTFDELVVDGSDVESRACAIGRDRHGGDTGEVLTVFGGAAVAEGNGDLGFGFVTEGQCVTAGFTFSQRGGASNANCGHIALVAGAWSTHA